MIGKSNRERLGLSKENLQKYAPIIGNLKTFKASPQQSAPVEDDLPEDSFQRFQKSGLIRAGIIPPVQNHK